jgi:hypothetical protein
LGPSLDTVFYHEIFGHGSSSIDHVIAVSFLAHARLAVAADGKTEILVFIFHRSRQLRHLWLLECSHLSFSIELQENEDNLSTASQRLEDGVENEGKKKQGLWIFSRVVFNIY